MRVLVLAVQVVLIVLIVVACGAGMTLILAGSQALGLRIG